MDTQQLQSRAKDIVADVLDIAPVHRDQHIAQSCGDNSELLAEVESLLRLTNEIGALCDADLASRQAELEQLASREAPNAPPAKRDLDAADEAARQPVRVGNYRIGSAIGEGSLGRVFQAVQDNVGRVVTLRLLHAGHDGRNILRRFESEAQALSRLDHPGIARLCGASSAEVVFQEEPLVTSEEPQTFIAMEFVDGVPLDEYVRSTGLTTEQKLHLVAQLCQAVHTAHRKGIIHRNLKPANVLVTHDGTGGVPKVLDFGLARIAVDAAAPGRVVGTPEYLSPEQFGDPRSADAASDVYALGVIAYELLAGRRPHEQGDLSIAEFGTRVREKRAAPLGKLDRSLAGDIEAIVAKALSLNPQDRYESAAAMAADIERALNRQPVLARPHTTKYILGKLAQRRRGHVAVASLLLVGLLSGLVAFSTQYLSASRRARIAGAVNSFLNDDLLKAARPQTPGGEPTLRDALDTAAAGMEGRFGNDPDVEAAIRSALGGGYQNLGAYDLAETQLDRALAVRKQALGAKHPGTLEAMNNLAGLYYLQGRFTDLEQITGEVLAVSVPRLGTDHPVSITAHANLGMAQLRAGRLKEAEHTLKTCVESARRTLGVYSPKTIQYMQNLSMVYMRLGRKQEAGDLSGEVWHLCETQFGPEHPDTISNAANYGAALWDLDRAAEAEPVLQAALAASRKVFGPNNADTLYTMNALAGVLSTLGRNDDAEKMYRETLTLRRTVLGPKHSSTVSTMYALARFYFQHDRHADALPLAIEAEQVHREISKKPTYKTVLINMLLGDIYAAQADNAGAERAYSAAVAAARESGDSGVRLGRALARLGKTQRKTGRADAGATLQDALGILKKELGPDHQEVVDLTRQM